jgi:hypothetical protein
MSVWAALVAIAGILAFVQIVKVRHGARHNHPNDTRDYDAAMIRENTELKREVEDLHERIKVLERIATDDRGAKRLSAEIEALRADDEIEERSKQ